MLWQPLNATKRVPQRQPRRRSSVSLDRKWLAGYRASPMKRVQNLIATCAAVLLPAAVAFAQAIPPQPNIPTGQRSPVWLGYIVAFIFVAILIIATLLPSKRSREDI